MPTTYTHDLFGKQIFKQLPGEMQEVIRKNGNLYRIGLHGPDILFYNMLNSKVPAIGVQMHKEAAAPFLERGMTLARENHDERILAYMLGFGCHYLLDSTCHPFVNKMAKQKVISHTLLEKEFDRQLMIETGKNPHHFYPSNAIHARIGYARIIHKVIPRVRTKDILISLKLQKFITNCMVYDNKGRRIKLLSTLSRIAGKNLSAEMMEYFMQKDPAPGSGEPVAALHVLYDEAVADSPKYLEEYYSLYHKKKNLSERWDKTYSG